MYRKSNMSKKTVQTCKDYIKYEKSLSRYHSFCIFYSVFKLKSKSIVSPTGYTYL